MTRATQQRHGQQQRHSQRTAAPAVLPPLPVLPKAPADDVDEPYVLSKPPTGKSGDLKLRKPIHDALCVDPQSFDPHVKKVTASFAQDVAGTRVAYLRLVLDDDAPTLKDLGETRLVARVQALTRLGNARIAAVLGPDFHAQTWFGGKHFRP